MALLLITKTFPEKESCHWGTQDKQYDNVDFVSIQKYLFS